LFWALNIYMQQKFYFICLRLVRSLASKRVVSRASIVGVLSLGAFFVSGTLALAYYAPSVLDPTLFSSQTRRLK
jgi:hypothetical protein